MKVGFFPGKLRKEETPKRFTWNFPHDVGWVRCQNEASRLTMSYWLTSLQCLDRNGQEQRKLGIRRTGLFVVLPSLCDLRLIQGSAEPQASIPLSVLQRGWMRWSMRSTPAVTFWESMNSKDTRQVRADHHVGSSHLSLPSVSAPHFQQCQTPGPVRVQLPILKLFKDSRPSAWRSFQPEAGLPSSLCDSLSHRLLGFACH